MGSSPEGVSGIINITPLKRMLRPIIRTVSNEGSQHIFPFRNECLPQIIIQSDHWKFQIFSRFIGVDWSITGIYEDRFHH